MMPSKIIAIMMRTSLTPTQMPQVPTQEQEHIYTLEEWQRLLIERYQTLKDTVFENMPLYGIH